MPVLSYESINFHTKQVSSNDVYMSMVSVRTQASATTVDNELS